jgi:tetratricopeptide (TPR) repeat protein
MRQLFLCSILCLSLCSFAAGQSSRINSGAARASPVQDPDVNRPSIRLSGKVVVDDGSRLPRWAAVETVCKGQKRIVAHTDSEGAFAFAIGEEFAGAEAMGAGLADASISASGGFPIGNTPNVTHNLREWRSCAVQAELPGFTSEVVQIISRTESGGDMGFIRLRRIGHVEGFTISATSAAAPEPAKKALDKGLELQRKNKWEAAQESLQKAVQIYPQYAVAWFELGRVQLQRRDINNAKRSFAQSLAADAHYANPYFPLARIAAQEQRWQDMADLTSKLLAVSPSGFPEAWYFNSVAQYNLGKLPEATNSAREGLKIDGEHHYPKLEYLLGLLLEEQRDYAGAQQHMQNYLHLVNNPRDVEEAKRQLEEIARLAAATPTANGKN